MIISSSSLISWPRMAPLGYFLVWMLTYLQRGQGDEACGPVRRRDTGPSSGALNGGAPAGEASARQRCRHGRQGGGAAGGPARQAAAAGRGSGAHRLSVSAAAMNSSQLQPSALVTKSSVVKLPLRREGGGRKRGWLSQVRRMEVAETRMEETGDAARSRQEERRRGSSSNRRRARRCWWHLRDAVVADDGIGKHGGALSLRRQRRGATNDGY